MSRLLRRLATCCAAAALVVLACRDATGPGESARPARLAFTPRFQVGAEGSRPISRIRMVAYDASALATPLVQQEVDVSPTDAEWPVSLEVPVPGGPRSVVVTVELLHRLTSGDLVVEWSGRLGPFEVTAGGSVTREDLALGRGPLDNLAVTAVAIGETPLLLVVGDSVDLVAIATPAVDPTRIYWGTIAPTVASVSATGRVRSLAAGTARISANVGLVADTVSITIVDRVTTVAGLFVAAGDEQVAVAGQPVPAPIRVAAFNSVEDPVPGVPITFAVTGGGGSLASTTALTDAEGIATAPAWTLGTVAGPNTLLATANGFGAFVSATGVAGAAATVAVSAGDAQAGAVSAVLPVAPAVLVRDANANPVAGVTVTFAVASGGGSVTGATATTNAQGIAAVGSWTLGSAPGPNTLTATVTGLTPVTFTATGTVGAATTLAIVEGSGQTAAINAQLPVAPRVRVTDVQGNNLAGIGVTFTAGSGGGNVGPAGSPSSAVTVNTGADGTASTDWRLGSVAGPNTLTAASGQLTPVTFTATAVPGPAAVALAAGGDAQTGSAGVPLAQPLVVRVRDAFGNLVAGVGITWATPDGGTLAPTTGTTNAQGEASATWTPGATATTQTATATAAGVATPATFTATVTLAPPQLQLALAGGADRVSLGRTQDVAVTLPTPAPAGGAVVTVASDAPTVLAVVGAGQATIAAGQVAGTVQVTGLAEGNATLTATAAGYDGGTLATGVQLRILTLPAALSVPYGQTASLVIAIPRPAPAGGLPVSLATSDATRVEVVTPTVTIPAGATSASATVRGVLPGPASIVATHPLYDPDTAVVTTAAALDVTQTNYIINASFGQDVVVRFMSGATAVAAPAPGIAVQALSRDPSCVSIPASSTIQTGLVSVNVPITQGGTTALPCTTRIVVSSPLAGIAPDSATVTVNPVPGITLSTNAVGRGLQRQNTLLLGASNHGGVTVRLTSTDSSRVLFSPGQFTPGTGFLDITFPAGNSAVAYWVQVLDDANDGTVGITATAPGFSNGAGAVNVVQPGVDINLSVTATSSLSAPTPFQVGVGVPSGTSFLSEGQLRRAGGAPLVVTVTTSDAAVGRIATTALTSDTVTALIQPAAYQTPNTVAAGGVAFAPAGAGSTVVSASIPGFVSTASAQRTVTVSVPGIATSTIPVGAALMRATTATLGASNHGGVTVRIQSTDSSRVLLSASDAVAGSGTVDIPVPLNATVVTYWVHAVEGAQPGNVVTTVTAPGFAPATATVSVVQPVLLWASFNRNTTTRSGDSEIQVTTAIQVGFNAINQQRVRAGGPPLAITVASDTPSVMGIVTSGGVGPSATLSLAAGQGTTPFTVAQGGVALRPLAPGVAVIRATAPGFAVTDFALDTVTVTQPSMTVGSMTVGAGLMRSQQLTLGASNHGGVTIRLESADPTRVLLATQATSPGAPFIDLVVPNNVATPTFWVHGLEGQTGAVQVSATAPGFGNGAGTATVVQPYIDIDGGLLTGTTTLSSNMIFSVLIGVPNSFGTTLLELQQVRTGGTPVTITATSSMPTVGLLGVGTAAGPTTSGTVVATIGERALNTFLQFDPLTPGTTVVTVSAPGTTTATGTGTRTVTVSAPALTVTTGPHGAGLQRTSFVTLGAPAPAGLRVRVASSEPSLLLVAPDATTVGSGEIEFAVATGAQQFFFTTQALEGQAGTVALTATAPGYLDGSADASISPAYVELSGVASTYGTTAANANVVARVGLPTANLVTLNGVMALRAGAPTRTFTITSSNPATAQLVTSGASGGSVTVQIAAGQTSSPIGLAAGGAQLDPQAAGNTTVAVSGTGFTPTLFSASVSVTVLAALVQALGAGAIR